jgi:hypothetical protein
MILPAILLLLRAMPRLAAPVYISKVIGSPWASFFAPRLPKTLPRWGVVQFWAGG